MPSFPFILAFSGSASGPPPPPPPPHKLPKMVRFPNLPYKEFSSAETGSIFQFLAFWAFISFHFSLVGLHFLSFWPFPGQPLGYLPPHKLPKIVRFPNLPYKEFSSAETGSNFQFVAFWAFISFYFGLVGLHFLSFWPCGPSFLFILAFWAFISFHFGLLGFISCHFGLLGLHCLSFSPFGPSFLFILALWAFISFHFGLVGLHFLHFGFVGFHFLAFWPCGHVCGPWLTCCDQCPSAWLLASLRRETFALKMSTFRTQTAKIDLLCGGRANKPGNFYPWGQKHYNVFGAIKRANTHPLLNLSPCRDMLVVQNTDCYQEKRFKPQAFHP